MDELGVDAFLRAGGVRLIVDGATLDASAVLEKGRGALRTRERRGPLPFVAMPDADTLSLAIAGIVKRRTIVPIHPRKPEAERMAIKAAVGATNVADDALAILATSGSSGAPKLVELERSAFVASAVASRANVPLDEGDRWLLAMPFAHAGGLSILTRCIEAGAAIVAHTKFEPRAAIEAIAHGGVTVLSVVPAMLRVLLECDAANAMGRLKAILVGGAACAPSLMEECARRGVPALATYGLTEACSQVTVQPLARPSERTTRDSGFPLVGTSVEIVDAVGGVGRIVVRGETLMRRYLGGELLGGELRTEDIGRIDDAGRLIVLGRVDDVIITGGENVHPTAVEAKLLAIEGVLGAIAVGLPDARWGEIVSAMIQVAPKGSLAEVRRRAEASMASFELPRVWLCVEELPATGIGKPDRRITRALLAAEQARRA